jgi:flagellar biosynthesis protein FlhF
MSQMTFRGRTLEDACKAAEVALGAGYVVLATKRTQKSALFGLLSSPEFEVTATAKEKNAPAPRPHVFADSARFVKNDRDDIDGLRTEVRNEVRTLRALFTRNAADERASIEPLAREIEAELGELHGILLDMQAERGGREASGPVKKLLNAAGIEGSFARTIARKVEERGDDASATETFKAVICETVHTAAHPLSRPGRRQIALIGPTGVGKTTTAAKLAAYAILEQKRTVKLISCDAFRVGAVEQLERFATLLGAEFCSVKTRHGLEEALLSTNADIVIIDTAGRPGTANDIESALHRVGKAAPEERDTLLCLPAALREGDARRLARQYAQCHPTALVVTKLDETVQPSGLVHAPLATKLPISALCFGQRVPEDISAAHPKAILDALCPPAARKASPSKPGTGRSVLS